MNFLLTESLVTENPIATVKKPKVAQRLIQPFTEAQVKALLAATASTNNPLRNKVILMLMIDTGLRVSELVNLKIGDVTSESLVIEGKGAKKRHVYMGQRVRREVKLYLMKERTTADSEAPLFVGSRGNTPGETLTPSGVQVMLRHLGAAAGIKGIRVSPHSCRHTFACMALRSGSITAFELMRIMGHGNVSVTQRYVNQSEADIARAHRNSSPIDRLMK